LTSREFERWRAWKTKGEFKEIIWMEKKEIAKENYLVPNKF